LELTHLALISYRLPDTGEVIPLLQIVPSKSNEERLLLVVPELASVLASVISRVRDESGRVPLAARYDPHERLISPPLPHLFQRKVGWRREIISTKVLYTLLNDTIERAGLTDRAGQPLRYTAHDFRRMFVTDAVTGGLPVHIAAKILGHHNINTTQAYLAVFQGELINSYRAFLEARRAVRPAAEYREPTEDEWQEFQQHFELRKVELGTCGRPYGTPCQHENACFAAPCFASSQHNAGAWKRSPATCATASTKPVSTAGSVKSKNYRSASTPPAASWQPSTGSPASSQPPPPFPSACRLSLGNADELEKRRGRHG
jgi:hypothetical protein